VHEFGPCTGIVEAARSRAGGRPVRRVRVRVGARHRFDPEVMRHTFALVAEGTELADAQLDIVVVEAEQTCGACGDTRTVADPVPVCPACGAVAVTARGGDELLLESLEYAG
jgi:hydrogenase nickel incorporation protein HypA/HybF